MFGGIEGRHVDVEKAYIGMLKGSPGSGGKVTVARADTNHQVSVFGETISSQGAGRANRAQVKWMIVAQAALARHRLAHRNARLLHEALQHPGRIRINRAAARHNERPFGSTYPGHRLL